MSTRNKAIIEVHVCRETGSCAQSEAHGDCLLLSSGYLCGADGFRVIELPGNEPPEWCPLRGRGITMRLRKKERGKGA